MSKVMVGKVNGVDYVSTNDGGVGQLLFKLQDAKQIKENHDNLVEENKALRAALSLKGLELECLTLARGASSAITELRHRDEEHDDEL